MASERGDVQEPKVKHKEIEARDVPVMSLSRRVFPLCKLSPVLRWYTVFHLFLASLWSKYMSTQYTLNDFSEPAGPWKSKNGNFNGFRPKSIIFIPVTASAAVRNTQRAIYFRKVIALCCLWPDQHVNTYPYSIYVKTLSQSHELLSMPSASILLKTSRGSSRWFGT